MTRVDERDTAAVSGEDVPVEDGAGADPQPSGRVSLACRALGDSWRRARPASKIGIVVFAGLLLSGLLASLLPLQDPVSQSLSLRNAGPSLQHLLGTDFNGRDVLSRSIYGSRTAFEGVGVAVLVALLIGVPWGLLAGLGGAVLDELTMRAADAVLAFPGILLALGVVASLGPSLVHAMIAVGFLSAPVIARLLRSATLPIRRAEYVLVARSLGVGRVRVALRHILPNAMGPVLVQIFTAASTMLIIEAGLNFLGFGVRPPTPSWGGDLANAYQYFTSNPFGTVVPGVVLVLGAWSMSAVGDHISEVAVFR